MDAMIQPIDTATFQGKTQTVENSSPALKPFNRVLKEKSEAPESPEKNQDQNPSKGAQPAGLPDFWVYLLGPNSFSMGEEGTEGVPENQTPIINENPGSFPGPAIAKRENLFIIQPELGPKAGASLNPESLSPGIESKALASPLEGAGGSKGANSTDPEKLPLLSMNMKELTQGKKPLPDAWSEAQGRGSKEGSTSFVNYLLTPEWDTETRFLKTSLASMDRENDLPSLIPRNIPISNFETEGPFSSLPKDPLPPNPEKFPNELHGLKNVDSNDPLLAAEPMTTPSLTGHGPSPSASAGAARLPRPISFAEASHLMNRIGERIVWSVKNNGEIIRLQLEPPELGNLAIKIEKEHNQIKATLLADNSLTKEILETHQSYLQKSLERDGFKLAQYDVFVQKDMESFHQFEDHFSSSGGPDRNLVPTPRPESDSAPPETPGIRALGRLGSRIIDRWV